LRTARKPAARRNGEKNHYTHAWTFGFDRQIVDGHGAVRFILAPKRLMGYLH
jgi:hypothetical protein